MHTGIFFLRACDLRKQSKHQYTININHGKHQRDQPYRTNMFGIIDTARRVNSIGLGFLLVPLLYTTCYFRHFLLVI